MCKFCVKIFVHYIDIAVFASRPVYASLIKNECHLLMMQSSSYK